MVGGGAHRKKGRGTWEVRRGWQYREYPGRAERRERMHKFPFGSGRKSDTPIVAKKRLIPVERRGGTVIALLTRKGQPLDGEPIHYGARW